MFVINKKMIHYIIASFSGKIESRKNREESEKVLAIQLDSLYKIFMSKKEKKIPNFITKITVVVPECNIESYRDYYDKTITNIEGVPIEYITYIGNNKDHSYDQWIQGVLCNINNFSYYLLIEDDYCIDTNNIWFDKELVDIYKQKFNDTNNIGYLSTLVWNKPITHAAISNGLLSKETVDYIHTKSGLTMLEAYYKLSGYPQLKFSELFNNIGILHKDISDYFRILFWDSPSQKILDYSTNLTCDSLAFIPCQQIYALYYSNTSASTIYKNIKLNNSI